MYKIFKQIAYLATHYKCSLVYDNCLNYVTIQIISCSGHIDKYSADTKNKWQMEQLSAALKHYTRPSSGATNNRTMLNYDLRNTANNL